MKKHPLLPWLEEAHIPALDQFLTDIAVTPVQRSSNEPNSERLSLGDTSVQNARIYVMPLDSQIMKWCTEDTKMYTVVKEPGKISGTYLKHLAKQFKIPETSVVKLDSHLLPLKDLLKHIEGLSKQWGASHMLLNNHQPGFSVYFFEQRVLLQFNQPLHRHQF